MKTKIEEVNKTRKNIIFSFEPEQIAEEKASVISGFVKVAKIAGFRPGKAPRDMVVERFGKDIDSELEKSLVNKSLKSLNDIKEFDILSVVDLKCGDLGSEKGADIVLVVDIYPEVKLPEDYKTTVELSSDEATEEEVQKTVDYYRNQRASYNEVDRAIAKGDFVRLSYEGTVDGKPLDEIMKKAGVYGKQSSTWEEAGNEQVMGVKGIVEGIIGMKKGDKKEIEHKFEKEFEDIAVAGLTAKFGVEILEVREKKLGDIDEEFLKSINAKDEAEFRAKLAEDIHHEKVQHNEVTKRQNAVDTLLSKVDFELPESIVEEEKYAVVQEMGMRMLSSGVTREQLESEKEKMFESAEGDARMRAKMKIFLNRVAKANDLKVTDEDMSRMLWQEAMRQRVKPDEILKQLKNDQGKVNRMRTDALLQKAINFIAEKVEVVSAKK